QRLIDQELPELVEKPSPQGDRRTIEDGFAVAPGNTDEGAKHPALEATRILHADHDARQHLLEGARRREEERRTDLLQVLHRGLATLRAGHAKSGDESLRVIEVVIADPSEWQIRQRFVAFSQVIEGDSIRRCTNAAGSGENNAFRCAGRTRRIENSR